MGIQEIIAWLVEELERIEYGEIALTITKHQKRIIKVDRQTLIKDRVQLTKKVQK